jgi:glycosyltransferase involved in cell wall biosynthesis
MVGDGPDRARYQAWCREREMNSVRFEGVRSQQDLPRYYGIADVFVFPTRSDPWGLVLNEAMCSGLPVICSTAAGAAADLVRSGQNGFLHELGDIATLKRHMSTLLSDDRLRLRMGKASREIIAGFGPQNMAQGFRNAVLQTHER